jgi:hypothetical protein
MEWEEQQKQNDSIQWGVEVTSWEATLFASPVPRVDVAGVGIWPGVTADQLAQAGTWPMEDEYLAEWVQVEVCFEVHSSVGELVKGHTACRSSISHMSLIRYLNLINHS